MKILDRLITEFVEVALREARDLAADGFSETDVREVVLSNNAQRVEGAVAALTAYIEDRERALGVVAQRSNADMLRMMADENRSEFKHDALVGVETIAAVLEAYQRGEVELDEVEGQGSGYQYLLPGGKKYSLATVARFLGG